MIGLPTPTDRRRRSRAASGLTTLGFAATLGLASVLGLAGALAVGAPAAAHNSVVATTPAEGATLGELPESFEIRTSDALLDLGGDGNGFAFLVQDADGLYYGDGCVRVVGPSMFTTPALGEPGAYTVTWQAVSADGHTISGTYPFTWAPDADADAGAGAAPSVGSAERPVCGEEPSGEPEPDTPAVDDGRDDAAGGGGASVPADVWWIVGAVGAIAVALVATLVATRRRPTG